MALKRKRGAGEVDIAGTLFNNNGPLLRMGRFEEAGKLLEACREIFDRERDFRLLGKVFGAMADLEGRQGDRDAAVSLQTLALKYAYQSGEPGDCAGGHKNLCNYLVRLGNPRERWLAHRLTDALICFQTESGLLQSTLRNLALSDLPEAVPSFDEVADEVEGIKGVRFRELFARLPHRAPNGDAALAEIWKMALQTKAEAEEQRAKKEAVLSSLPTAVRKAFELKGQEFSDALKAAIEQLPADQRESTLAQLYEAGLLARGLDKAAILHQFEPFIREVVAIVNVEADAETRAKIEEALPRLEEKGWHLSAVIQRIFSGDREPEALTAELDEQDTVIVRHILELL